MQIGSLFMALGFDVDDKKLDGFSGKIKGLKAGLGGLAGIAAAGVGALSAMAITGAKTAVNLSNAESTLNSTTDAIQRFNNVAQQVNPNITLDQSISQLKAFQKAITDSEWAEGATGTLNMLGIDPQDSTPTEFFGKVRDAWQDPTMGVSQEKLLDLLRSTGFDDSFTKMLDLSDAEYNRLESRDIVSKENINKFLELSRAMEKAGAQAGLLSSELGAATTGFLTPVFNELESMLKFFRGKSVELTPMQQWSADMEKGVNDWFSYVFSKESLGDLSKYLRGENERLGLQRMKQEDPEKFNQLMRDRYIENRGATNTTNNINIESTADAKDLTESVFETIEMQQNKSIAGELPNISQAGIR